MANKSQLIPDGQFPQEALKRSVQEFPNANEGLSGDLVFTWNLATSADTIPAWGISPQNRDRELRNFFQTETFLSSALLNVALRNATYQWEIQGPSDRVENAVSDTLNSAIAGPNFGWFPYIMMGSQDISNQDNGWFTELIRDPGIDGASKFKNEKAPVLGIAHLDSNQCMRTGDPTTPVLYTDRRGKRHKLAWYQVISFADMPSPIERMNGIGFCAVSRILRAAQIMRSIAVYKDEKISGRQYKQIHFVSGINRQEIKDEMKRGQEEANNSGFVRFILPSIIAGLDPEKPVSTATIDLASLPDGFDFDVEMRWYISGLALAFGVDYQEFAPLPSSNIGSSAQSEILSQKAWGKWPAAFTKAIPEMFRNFGVLPRNCKMVFNDRNEAEELERQTIRTKAMEELAIAVNSHVLSPEAAARSLVARGIYKESDIAGLEDFWKKAAEQLTNPKQPVGSRGGNTIVEDAKRQDYRKTQLNGWGSPAQNDRERRWLVFVSR